MRSTIRTICLASALILTAAAAALSEETYGPPNLLKTMSTPFGAASPESGAEAGRGAFGDGRPIAISSAAAQRRHRSLADRLVPSRLYLPGRMVLGRPAEFIIKGKPGSFVALAMADRDSGARPVQGHAIRLGPDRKLVSLGQVPDSGVLTLVIETPIQGDLIGERLFFEAALWNAADFSDMELADTVGAEGQAPGANGVPVTAEQDRKRGIKFVPDSAVPLQQRERAPGLGLGAGGL